MGLKKKLVKHGNSYAIIIDKPIMELLGITPDTELDVQVIGSKMEIEPVYTELPEDIKESYERVKSEHYNTFKKLAE